MDFNFGIFDIREVLHLLRGDDAGRPAAPRGRLARDRDPGAAPVRGHVLRVRRVRRAHDAGVRAPSGCEEGSAPQITFVHSNFSTSVSDSKYGLKPYKQGKDGGATRMSRRNHLRSLWVRRKALHEFSPAHPLRRISAAPENPLRQCR